MFKSEKLDCFQLGIKIQRSNLSFLNLLITVNFVFLLHEVAERVIHSFPCQKQLFSSVLQNRCSWKFCKFHRKTPVLESVFNKVAGLTFWRTPFFAEHLAASGSFFQPGAGKIVTQSALHLPKGTSLSHYANLVVEKCINQVIFLQTAILLCLNCEIDQESFTYLTKMGTGVQK